MRFVQKVNLPVTLIIKQISPHHESLPAPRGVPSGVMGLMPLNLTHPAPRYAAVLSASAFMLRKPPFP